MKLRYYEKIIIFQALIISLLLHLTGYWILPKKTLNLKDLNSNKEVIELTVAPSEPPQKTKKQTYIKELDKLRQLNRRVKKKAKILSLNQKRYKRQTIAQKSGQSQNAEKSGGSKSANFRKLDPQARGLKVSDLRPDIGLSVSQKRAEKRRRGYRGTGITTDIKDSSFSSYIPNVDKATMTALDTDVGSLKYYTFYMRLHEQIRPRWVGYLKDIVYSLPSEQIKQLSRKPQITTLEVVLNKKGEYVGSFVIQKAQKHFLDVAAISAFKKAAPFVNPPKGLIEEDGHIYIPFKFRVELSPHYFARKNK